MELDLTILDYDPPQRRQWFGRSRHEPGKNIPQQFLKRRCRYSANGIVRPMWQGRPSAASRG